MTTTASNHLNCIDKSKHLQMLQMLQISTRTAKPTSLYLCFLHNNGCTVPLSNVYKNICKKSSSCCKMHATPSTSTLQEVLLPPMMPSSCKPAYFCMESPSMQSFTSFTLSPIWEIRSSSKQLCTSCCSSSLICIGFQRLQKRAAACMFFRQCSMSSSSSSCSAPKCLQETICFKQLQICYKYAANMLQMPSNIFQIASNMLQTCFKYASNSLQYVSNSFKYVSNMLQICYKYATNMLQIGFKYA